LNWLKEKMMSKITNNFSLQEFNSKCGREIPDNVLPNIIQLAKNLQVLRDSLGKTISITSGYRSPQHNKKIGGAKDSQHIKGMAADIKVSGMTPKEVALVIEGLIESGKMKQGGIGIYPSWIHYDIRGTKARW
jgi:uncharacterized protein YcbK (DUF882 family)